MINWLSGLLRSRPFQPEYGVVALYGVQNPEPVSLLLFIIRFAVLPVVVPIVLTVGVLVYMKIKAYPLVKRVWAVVIMLAIYFSVLLSAALLLDWF